jgi:hypothetical protein
VDLRLDTMIVASGSFALPANAVRQQNFVGKTLYGMCNSFYGKYRRNRAVFAGCFGSRALADRKLPDRTLELLQGLSPRAGFRQQAPDLVATSASMGRKSGSSIPRVRE